MVKAAAAPLLTPKLINLTGIVDARVIACARDRSFSIEFSVIDKAKAQIYIGSVIGVVTLPYVTQLTSDPQMKRVSEDILANSADFVEKIKVVHDQVQPYLFKVTDSQPDNSRAFKRSRTVSPVLAEAAPLAAPQSLAAQNVVIYVKYKASDLIYLNFQVQNSVTQTDQEAYEALCAITKKRQRSARYCELIPTVREKSE